MSQRLQSGAGAHEYGPAPKTVLVVDDEDALLRVLALVLEEAGYHVITAHDGRSALDAVRAQPADLVVTDFMMPEIGGGELVSALLEARPRTPVIVMSSLEENVVSRQCAGHARFFRKPFDVPEFLQSVATLSAGTRDHLRLVK